MNSEGSKEKLNVHELPEYDIFISLDEILKRVEIVNEDLKEEEDMLSKKEYNAAFSEEFSFNLKNYALVKN